MVSRDFRGRCVYFKLRISSNKSNMETSNLLTPFFKCLLPYSNCQYVKFSGCTTYII